jgi:hypothetical protein
MKPHSAMEMRNEVPLRYAWAAVALLIPVALLNYLDRQMLATMKFSLMTDIPDIGSEAKWGQDSRPLQVDICARQPGWRILVGPVQPASCHRGKSCGLVGCYVGYRTGNQL